MRWIDGTDKKLQAFHWLGFLGVEDLKFMSGGGDPGSTDCIDFLELAGRQQSARTIKLVMGDIGGGSGSYVAYNVWFADSKTELEDLVQNGTPTKIFFNPYAMPQPTVFTFNLSTRYMAINFDSSIGNVDVNTTHISIYAY